MKISVITSVFNNRAMVAGALDSILAQTYPNVQLVVIDGDSTDGTQEELARYADKLGVYVSEPDAGIYDALNKGIALSSGEVIGFLHSDDVLADVHVLSRVAEAFADPEVGAVYGDLVYVRRSDAETVVRYWRAGEFSSDQLRWGWMPPHPTLYVRRHVFSQLGVFDISYQIAADYECMLRMLTSGVRCRYLPHVLVKMRLGGASNRSIASVAKKSLEDYRALRTHGIGAVRALLGKNLRKVPQFFMR